MRLIYAYIREFRNIFDEDFNFSLDFNCSFVNNKLSIRHLTIPVGERLLLDEFQERLTLIVGKTGTGKSNLLQLIGLTEEKRLQYYPDASYFLLYVDESRDNRFVIETSNLIPKGLHAQNAGGVRQKVFDFEYINGRIIRHSLLKSTDTPNSVIVYSYDSISVSPRLFPKVHENGTYQDSFLIPRMALPYQQCSPSLLCWYVQQSFNGLSEDNVKRDVVLEISSINWSERITKELPDEVMKEYRFYHNNLRDKDWNGVLDVPKFFEDKTLPADGKSFKEQFVHDLLTDYALYLRKWAEVVTPVSDVRLRMYRDLDMIKDLGIKDFHLLPDGRCNDLRTRINWLCQYLDVHTDEINANKGLIWQAGTDIVDIADALEKFDDECFSDGKFQLYVEDMKFDTPPLKDLFERMGNYRADQLGAFREELLPYEVKPLSSGEYQITRVLGVLNEFSAKRKIHNSKYQNPDSIIILLDEPETFLHPELCRVFLSRMAGIVMANLRDVNVQVIMSTHSPFMLSDVLSRQIIRITTDEEGCCRKLENKDNATPTFAGDILSIMANDFFFDFSIGELSRIRIMNIISLIKRIKGKKELSEDDILQLEVLKEVLPNIGDLMIREALERMIES